MNIKLLPEHNLELEAMQACLSLHLSKCQIDGNHMSRLICLIFCINICCFPQKMFLNTIPSGVLFKQVLINEKNTYMYVNYIFLNKAILIL